MKTYRAEVTPHDHLEYYVTELIDEETKEAVNINDVLGEKGGIVEYRIPFTSLSWTLYNLKTECFYNYDGRFSFGKFDGNKHH